MFKNLIKNNDATVCEIIRQAFQERVDLNLVLLNPDYYWGPKRGSHFKLEIYMGKYLKTAIK